MMACVRPHLLSSSAVFVLAREQTTSIIQHVRGFFDYKQGRLIYTISSAVVKAVFCLHCRDHNEADQKRTK